MYASVIVVVASSIQIIIIVSFRWTMMIYKRRILHRGGDIRNKSGVLMFAPTELSSIGIVYSLITLLHRLLCARIVAASTKISLQTCRLPNVSSLSLDQAFEQTGLAREQGNAMGEMELTGLTLTAATVVVDTNAFLLIPFARPIRPLGLLRLSVLRMSFLYPRKVSIDVSLSTDASSSSTSGSTPLPTPPPPL